MRSGSFSSSSLKRLPFDSTPKHPVKEATKRRVTVSAACLLILVELLERKITLLNSSVIYATGSMDMPMGQFFFGSRPNVNDFYFES